MTVRELLNAARDSAVELRRIDEEAELKREAIGVQGHGYGMHSKVGIRDPARRIDELLDWENAQRTMPDITAPIDEAWDVMSGVSLVTDDATLDVAVRYYLQGESWREIVDGHNGSKPASEMFDGLTGMRRDEQLKILPKAMDETVGHWEAYGIAHLKEMGRQNA